MSKRTKMSRRTTLADFSPNVIDLQRLSDEVEGLPLESKYRVNLRRWNFVVAIVQLISFLSVLIISLVNLDTARRVDLWVVIARGTAIRDLGSYPLFVTLVLFPFITAIFHLLALANVDNYYIDVLTRGRNRLRWIEYAITNSLMTLSLFGIAGAGSVVIFVLGVLANCLMQYFGFLHEDLMHTREPSKRNLVYIGVGFLPWLQIWITILVFHGLNFGTAVLSDNFAIFGSFLWSLAFVLPLLWFYRKSNTSRNYYTLELMYIFLSLTAKLYLDWTVVIGGLVGN